MPESGDSFTLYLRGGDGLALRTMLKPFGNGGDLERWKLDAWDAEVVVGKAAEVALIRVPQTIDMGSLKTLIIELHQAAQEAGLVLSDDVHSKKSAAELIAAFGLAGDTQDAMHKGRPNARWGMNLTVLYWIAGGALLVGVYYVFQFVSSMAHIAIQGGP